jgi:hypothetical protein
MKKTTLVVIGSALLCQGAYAADSITDAMMSGKANVNLNLRYETVEQDNPLQDATALTLRTRIGYTTAVYKSLSAMIEMEDSRIVGGQDEFSVGPAGFNPGIYSVIADPETTELEQAFVKYADEGLTAKLGRQVITYDGHRFVGHVGWRQDRQTFDALKMDYKASEKLSLSYSYLWKRNRIFAESADVDSKDSLVNVAYKSGLGTITGYGYFLELDNDTDNALDTVGISFKGTAGENKNFKYVVEYASQTNETGATEFDTDYLFLEGAMKISGVTAKLGYEVLGSDDGLGGFATPLATLHKFNGFADVFLGTPAEGLVDVYASATTKLGGGKFVLAYHDFSADEASASVDDMGNELDFIYARKFAKNYSAGIKYASYSAGDIKADTDKLWLWAGLSF